METAPSGERPQKHRYSTVQSDAVPFFVTCRSGGKIRGKRNGARFAPSPTEPDTPEHGPKGRRLNMRPAMHRQPVLRRRCGHTAARARPQAFRKVPPEEPPYRSPAPPYCASSLASRPCSRSLRYSLLREIPNVRAASTLLYREFTSTSHRTLRSARALASEKFWLS